MSSLSPAWKELRRQSIFRTASAVFMGSTIHANDRGAIRAIISSHPAKFQSVEKMYGSDMVVQIISSLLDNGTFASESNDRLEAPKTHRPSPVRDKQHDALEQEAAQSEAKALDEASRADLAIYDGDQCGEQINVAETGPIEDSSGPVSTRSPSLFPSFLSYAAQHKLLNTVQRVLEDCCYDWVAKWIPSLLEQRNWTCSEAVELGRWTVTIPERFDTFSFDATALGSGEALRAVFLATHPLRHAAVHRLRTSVRGIERMLKNALNLATALQDTQRKCKLHDILEDFRATMRAMEASKNDLENALDEEIRDIQEQRAALDEKEKEARLSMLREDRENTAQISCRFENSIRNLSIMDEPSPTGTEQDNATIPGSEKACDDAVAGRDPDKRSADGVHHTTGEADCGSGNADSKPSKHSDSGLTVTGGLSENSSVENNQITASDTSYGNRGNKANDQGGSETKTADSTRSTVPPFEIGSAALPSDYDLDEPTLPSQSTGQ